MLKENNIILRRFISDDRAPMATLANNKEIWNNLRDLFPFPYTEQDAENFINLTKQEAIPLTFAIEYKGHFCGVIGLKKQTDVYKKTAEIGYWIGEPFWNKGIATTSVRLLTAYGMGSLVVVRIYTGVFEYNIGSMRVLEKNGYEKDGIFKKAIFKNGNIWDEHRFSIVK